MRIAQVSPLIESVPPKCYGGIERVVHYLTESLVSRGHDVTLFASGDSQTSADHLAVVRESLRQSNDKRDPFIWHTLQLAEILKMVDKFDVVHFHTDIIHYPAWRQIATPQVTTLHGRLDMPDLKPTYDEFGDMAVVSISDSQRTSLPQAGWVSTVYNGIPAENFTFQAEPGDYFAFLGRISPEKGPDHAIEIAKRTKTPLRIAAKIDAVDREYFTKTIEPLLEDPLIDYIGEVNEEEKDELLGGAKALLFPIDWPEPFGLVMTEAMACGTPVIAFRCGSVPEVMKDGISGFIVDTVEEAVAAVSKLSQIDRWECRQYFERNFSVSQMTDGYLEVYRKLIGGLEVMPRFPRWERPAAAAKPPAFAGNHALATNKVYEAPERPLSNVQSEEHPIYAIHTLTGRPIH